MGSRWGREVEGVKSGDGVMEAPALSTRVHGAWGSDAGDHAAVLEAGRLLGRRGI